MSDAERTQVEKDSRERAARQCEWLANQETDPVAIGALMRAATQLRKLPVWPGIVAKPPISDLPAGGSAVSK